MKKCLLFLFLILANVTCVYSQIIAGNAAAGLIISDPAINFSVTTFTSDRRAFDLDCDGFADMAVELKKGPTFIDASNNAYLRILNPVFQVCADTANWQPHNINYFNLGDTIGPAGSVWYHDTIIQLGNCGCMDCPGPCSATDLYLGYKNTITLEVGWIKISFNLIDGGGSSVPITLSVPEVLSPCITTSVSVSTSTSTYTSSGIASCWTFTYSYTIDWPSCPGMCDASISISNVTGGTPAYTYSWNTAPMQTTSTNFNVCSGTSMVVISDAAGNTCTSTFLVQDPPSITFSLSSTNVSCNGAADASVCCTNLTGGNAPYLYTWASSGSTSCINNISAGLYNLLVTDANGCVATQSIVISEPTAIQVNESVTHASCASCCDGSSQLQINGGTSPYVINYGPTTPSCPGPYVYGITDANGCIYVDSVLISYPTSLIEHEIESMFDVFPNPTKGELNVKCHLGSEAREIQLINTLGEIVLEVKNSKDDLLLNISDQPNGIYILTIRQNGLFSSVKIIKE